MSIITRICNYLTLYRFRRKWRKLNMHNQTNVNRIFSLAVVSVGKYTYRTLEMHTWGEPEQGLEIGSYVSIAQVE